MNTLYYPCISLSYMLQFFLLINNLFYQSCDQISVQNVHYAWIFCKWGKMSWGTYESERKFLILIKLSKWKKFKRKSQCIKRSVCESCFNFVLDFVTWKVYWTQNWLLRDGRNDIDFIYVTWFSFHHTTWPLEWISFVIFIFFNFCQTSVNIGINFDAVHAR